MADTGRADAVFIFAAWFAFLYVCSGVLALGGGYMGGRMWGAWVEHEWVMENRTETVLVIVAARVIPAGATITEADLYAVEMKPRWVPENVHLNPAHSVGRTAGEDILQNELVREERLVPDAER